MTARLPATQRALKIEGPGKVALVETCPLPRMQNNDVLVRVACVSLNPADGKSADMSPSVGATSGCDFSGEVTGVGDAVSNGLHIGDRVCGCVFGNNPFRLDNGAFAEYVAVPARLVFKIPEGMSFQSAATMGTGLATVGLALYNSLHLPLPSSPAEKPAMALVYGGGTATGALAIQMLRL